MNQNQNGRALVLLSGGLDSTVCATLAVQQFGAENVGALNVYYGQKHKIERESAQKVKDALGIQYLEMPLDETIFVGGGSTLVDPDKPNPETTYEELSKSYGVSPTYVPFRNGNLLSVAAAVALKHRYNYIYFGAHAEDARGWAYPDCTPEFNGAMANAIYVGTYRKVRLVTPLQWLTKADVVRLGLEISAPLHLTHSCYNGVHPACGKCPTCVSRIQAFKQNLCVDPVPYAIKVDWGDCTPFEYEPPQRDETVANMSIGEILRRTIYI